MNSRLRTILVFLSSTGDYTMQQFAGIEAYAHARNWRLQTVEYAETRRGKCTLRRSPYGSNILKLLEFWRPDGCIVECSAAPHLLKPADLGTCPAVFLESYPSPRRSDVACVYSDAVSIAETAARELLMSDRRDYGYVPYPTAAAWSRERGQAFADIIRLHGKNLHVFDWNREKHRGTASMIRSLTPWIRTLPKPCGIFAVNDEVAEVVVLACAQSGVSIPEEVSLVGVDNFTFYCENTCPTISSVSRDFPRAGEIAAALLDEMLDHPGDHPASRTYLAGGLVRRESSRIVRFAEPRVKRALEYIRLHACEGIGPLDVVAQLGCSRRMADLCFTRALGHTMLDEIHEVRLSQVKERLRKPDVNYAALPDFCGYKSLVDLRRVFKKRVGMTMGEYRQRL